MRYENNENLVANYSSIRNYTLILFVVLMIASIIGAAYGSLAIILLPVIMLIVLFRKEVFDWANMITIYAAVLLLIPVSPYKIISNLPVDIEFNRIVAVILLAFWFVALLVDPSIRLRRTRLELPIFAFATALIMSVVVNQDFFLDHRQFVITGKALLRFASFIVIFYLIASSLGDIVKIERVLKFLTVIAVIISIVGITERLTGYNFFYHLDYYIPFLYADPGYMERDVSRGDVIRVTATIDHPIALSVVLAMILPITIHFILASKRALSKAFYLISAVLSIITMLLTVSATALVALAVIIGWLMIVNLRYGLLMVLILALGLAVITNIFPGTMEALMNRVSPTYIQENEIGTEIGGAGARLSDYPKIWRELVYRPWLGYGFGTWDHDKYFYLDNQYLKFAREIGFLGLIAFVWLSLAIITRFWLASRRLQRSRQLILSLAVSLLVYVTTCITFDTFAFTQVTQLFFVLTAIGVSITYASQDQRQQEIVKFTG